jgi:acylphosphatase
VQGIGFIDTPVEEGAKEEGVGCIVVDIHGDGKVEMIDAGSQMKV